MYKLIFILFFMSFNLYSQNMTDNIARSLFADHKATQVGDAVTILIVEQSSAENGASTKTSRDSKISVNASGGIDNKNIPTVSGSAATGNGFQGSGSTSNKGTVKAKLSAKITEIDDNGNLKIEGTRNIIINKEEQIIKISGTIRPQDIGPDNTIYSYNISDAIIIFQGDGIVSSAQGPGWITKLLHWLF
ncbi:MAG TPA: flagellar basal body L-ring protein FlgH [Bacteroidota bacterium]|jgi:flagellar L-ring protein precursor FlgH|nr:flagellar basal body L-ring protein FlgH [Bacteroidota bacterium]